LRNHVRSNVCTNNKENTDALTVFHVRIAKGFKGAELVPLSNTITIISGLFFLVFCTGNINLSPYNQF
jgi:hypothetical protein